MVAEDMAVAADTRAVAEAHIVAVDFQEAAFVEEVSAAASMEAA